MRIDTIFAFCMAIVPHYFQSHFVLNKQPPQQVNTNIDFRDVRIQIGDEYGYNSEDLRNAFEERDIEKAETKVLMEQTPELTKITWYPYEQA